MLPFRKIFHRLLATAVCCTLASAGEVHLRAQVEGPQPTRVLVRVEGKDRSQVNLRASDVQVEVAGQKRDVTRVSPLVQQPGLSGNRSQPVEVALLLDEGLRGNFGVNLKDVEKFVGTTTSASTAVGVGYMRNGSVYFPQSFSHDAEVAKKAIRLPLSSPGINGSPYFCLEDLMKHWPTQTGAARVVLMVTNGIDLYNGSVSPLNQNSPYVDEAIRYSQRAAVPVYSIYFGGRNINNNFGSFSGQNYLAKVAEETGGITFNQGSINPPSLDPYFKRFQEALANTYVVEFLDGSKRLERMKISTALPGVKLHAQHDVQAGAGSLGRSGE